ncbi:hypothetical protein LX69_00594 [Breznakibacter xylanolyticus]|uniref:Uncharacterized protein n=1 Tax=Breznakibacter xylanolyticus TaxID=990 RepID=A0A2W7NJV4_9BACT|nr:hypothetical protein LX69_00594 [Breznakibacter xylanolyticus]
MRIGAIWCRTIGGMLVDEEGGDLFGGEAGEGAKLVEGDELVGLFVITAPDACQQVAAISVAFAGDALHVFGVDGDAGSFHGWILLMC